MDDFFDDDGGMDNGFDDDCGELDFWDWGVIGGLSEELAREKRDIERARREWDEDENLGYWEWLDRK